MRYAAYTEKMAVDAVKVACLRVSWLTRLYTQPRSFTASATRETATR